MILELPYPPSMNHYWRSGRGHIYISKEGLAYRARIYAMVGEVDRFECRLSVTIFATMPDRRKRDLDNLYKVLLDALTKAGVWVDDSQIDHLAITRGPVAKPGGVRVEILPCSPPYTPATATRSRSKKLSTSGHWNPACGSIRLDTL